MSKSAYDDRLFSSLQRECYLRHLPFQRSPSRSCLVELLEESDRANLPRRILIIGKTKSHLVMTEISTNDKDTIVFTGHPDSSLNTVEWHALATAEEEVFQTVYLFTTGLLVTRRGSIHPPAINILLRLLDPKGDLYLLDSSQYSRVAPYLKDVPFRERTTLKLPDDRSVYLFRHSTLGKLSQESLPRRSSGKYRQLSTDLQLKDEIADIPRITITLSQFKRIVKRPAFIARYTQSLRSLLKAKLSFYTRKKAEIEGDKKSVVVRTISLSQPEDKGPNLSEELEKLIKEIYLRLEKLNEDDIGSALKESLENEEEGLGAVVGRKEIKDHVASVLYSFAKSYRSILTFNNMALLGVPGSGKTHLSAVLGYVFSKAGVLIRGKVKSVSAPDLVSPYVANTAHQTRKLLVGSLESILLIDEVYELSNPFTRHNHGREAVAQIVNFLDKFMGMSMVIVAGYEKKTQEMFFGSNAGLRRRFPHQFVLERYSQKHLTDMLVWEIEKQMDKHLQRKVTCFLYTVIGIIEPCLGNQAGDILNLASSIVRTINSSYCIRWSSKNFERNKAILMVGINTFLRNKDVSLGKL